MKGKKTQKGEENGYLQEPETHNVLFILQIFLLVLFLFAPHTPTSFNSTSIFVLKQCFFSLFLFFFDSFLLSCYTFTRDDIYRYKRSGWNGSGHQLKPRRMEIFLNNSGLVIKEILFMQKFVVKDSMDYY